MQRVLQLVGCAQTVQELCQRILLRMHLRNIQRRTEICVRPLLLFALDAEFRSVIDRRDARHCVEQRVDQRQMPAVAELRSQTRNIVIIREIVEQQSAVDILLPVYRVVDLEVVFVIVR